MKVSIITAVWNNVSTIREAIESVLGQDYPQLEYIVVDGASTDGTLEIVAEFGSRISKVISGPDRGIYDALNKGMQAATGDVVGILHSDDIFASPGVISRVVAAFAGGRADLCYGNLNYVRKDDVRRIVRRWIAGEFRSPLLGRGWMPPHPTVFMSRGLLQRTGSFDLRYRIAADYDFLVRALRIPDVRVVYLDEVLVSMRVGGASNKSLANILRKSREDLQVIRENGVGGIGTLLLKNVSKISQFL